jgi:hypothetical protein
MRAGGNGREDEAGCNDDKSCKGFHSSSLIRAVRPPADIFEALIARCLIRILGASSDCQECTKGTVRLTVSFLTAIRTRPLMLFVRA